MGATDHGRVLASKTDFELTETKASGRQLFRSQTSRAVIKLDPDHGYLKYMANELLQQPDAAVGRWGRPAVESLAARHFAELGLPESEKGNVRSTPLMAIGEDHEGARTAPTAVAEIVEFPRTVNGIEVLRSRARFFYGPSGKLVRASVSWPEFRLAKESVLRQRDRALVEIVAHVSERRGPTQDVGSLRSRLVYRFDEENLVYEPAIVTSVTWAPRDAQVGIVEPGLDVEYSLYRGIAERKRGYRRPR